jgi:hypothetical protein
MTQERSKELKRNTRENVILAGKGENGEIFYFATIYCSTPVVYNLDDDLVPLRTVSSRQASALRFAAILAVDDPPKFLAAFRKYAPDWDWDFFEP